MSTDAGISATQWATEQSQLRFLAGLLPATGTFPNFVGTFHGQEPEVLRCPATLKTLLYNILTS